MYNLGSTTEGNIFSKVFQKSKKIRGKDHNESTVSPTISNPILGEFIYTLPINNTVTPLNWDKPPVSISKL